MIFISPYKIDVPTQDVLSYLFSQDAFAANEQVWCSAVDPSVSVTRAQAKLLTERIGSGLRKLGLGRDGPGKDIMITILENQVMIAPLFFGTLCAGGIFATCPPTATEFELARQINSSVPRLLVCSETTLQVAMAALKRADINNVRLLIVDSKLPFDLQTENDRRSILDTTRLEWEKIQDKEILENRIACLVYSSGTTGIPKGVKISHRNLVANVEQIAFHFDPLGNRLRSQGLALTMPGILPNSHAAGVMIHTCLPLRLGLRVYLVPKYQLSLLVEYIRTYRLTVLFGVPTIWQQLIYNDSVKAADLASVRFAMSGAAALPVALQNDARGKFPQGVSLITNWGMTEVVCEAAQFSLNEVDNEGAVGRLMPNMEARIVGSGGEEMGFDQPGELLIRGPNVTRGYYNNPDATAGAVRDGWLHTGDLARFSASGKLFIVGRLKELIKYKGNQVSPTELESVVFAHPGVADVGVIGVPTSDGNELPRAYVVRKSAYLGATEVLDWVRNRVSGYKQLRGGVFFVDEIPRNPSGKILRGVMKEWLEPPSTLIKASL